MRWSDKKRRLLDRLERPLTVELVQQGNATAYHSLLGEIVLLLEEADAFALPLSQEERSLLNAKRAGLLATLWEAGR